MTKNLEEALPKILQSRQERVRFANFLEPKI